MIKAELGSINELLLILYFCFLHSKKVTQPKPSPRTKFSSSPPLDFDLPDLPSVPVDNLAPSAGSVTKSEDDDIDFDDLTRRFEELKKKK